MINSHPTAASASVELPSGHYSLRASDKDHVDVEAAHDRKRRDELAHLATFGNPEAAQALQEAQRLRGQRVEVPVATEVPLGHYALRASDSNYNEVEAANSQKRGAELDHLATFVPPAK